MRKPRVIYFWVPGRHNCFGCGHFTGRMMAVRKRKTFFGKTPACGRRRCKILAASKARYTYYGGTTA